jgi:diguanylate cyclase (GGDEF)-like protein
MKRVDFALNTRREARFGDRNPHAPETLPRPSGTYGLGTRRALGMDDEKSGEVQRVRERSNRLDLSPAYSRIPLLPARDSFDLSMPAICFAIAASHWLMRSELGLSLLVLTPWFFIVFRRGHATAYVYAGFATVLLSAADLVHQVPPTTVAWLGGIPPHRVLSLLILMLIMLQLRRVYVGLLELTRRDPLTGLLNRRGFEELAAIELERAGRYGRPVAFALVDLDRFKEVNDRFGHAQGDAVLQVVGEELARLRASDLAVRLGGDEFGLLMPETDEAAARTVVARLENRVRERVRSHGWGITLSVGVAATGYLTRSIAALMAEADRRMYLNKPPAERPRFT